MSSQDSKPLGLFFADAHLDTGAWANRPALRDDSLMSFRYVCNYAVTNNIPHVFGAGDLIDIKKPPPEVVQFVREQLSLLEASNCHFHFIQGQHEYSPDLPWFCAIHDWPVWINERHVDIDGVVVYGMDWRTLDKVQTALDNIPPSADLLLMHQVWEEFMGEKRGCECSFAQVPTAHTVFTGDFHVNRVLESFRGADGQELLVISPGSTNMRKIDEDPDKYFYVLYPDRWAKIQIPTRRKLELTIAAERDLAPFADKFNKLLVQANQEAAALNLPDKLTRHLCRVKYVDDVEGAYATIKQAVEGSNVELFLKPIPPKTGDAASIERKEFDAKADAGLIGMLEAVLPRTDNRFKVLSRLLTPGTDMKVELQRMKKERGL